MSHPIYHIILHGYFVVGVSPSKMKIGSSFVSGSAAAAAKLRKVGVSLMLITLMLMMLMIDDA